MAVLPIVKYGDPVLRNPTKLITEFDEQSTFAELEPRDRRAAEDQLLGALSRLSPEELTVRMPVVYVVGTAR